MSEHWRQQLRFIHEQPANAPLQRRKRRMVGGQEILKFEECFGNRAACGYRQKSQFRMVFRIAPGRVAQDPPRSTR